MVRRIRSIKKYVVGDNKFVTYHVVLRDGRRVPLSELDFTTEAEKNLLTKFKEEKTGREAEGDGKYDVDKIISHRQRDNQTFYLVAWKDWEHPLWNSEMTEEQLPNCSELLREYKATVPSELNEETNLKRAATGTSEETVSPKKKMRTEKSWSHLARESEETLPSSSTKSSEGTSSMSHRLDKVRTVEDQWSSEEEDDFFKKKSYARRTGAPIKPSLTKEMVGTSSMSQKLDKARARTVEDRSSSEEEDFFKKKSYARRTGASIKLSSTRKTEGTSSMSQRSDKARTVEDQSSSDEEVSPKTKSYERRTGTLMKPSPTRNTEGTSSSSSTTKTTVTALKFTAKRTGSLIPLDPSKRKVGTAPSSYLERSKHATGASTSSSSPLEYRSSFDERLSTPEDQPTTSRRSSSPDRAETSPNKGKTPEEEKNASEGGKNPGPA